MVESGSTFDGFEVSERLRRWIEREFAPDAAAVVVAELRAMPTSAYGRQDPERIQAAHVFGTGGDWDTYVLRRDLARRDWRDLLMAGGLGYAGWEMGLDELLGSVAHDTETAPTPHGEQGGGTDDEQGERQP